MRRVTLTEKSAAIRARWAVVGKPDAETIARARNNGLTRTESKRELLAAIEEARSRLAGRRSRVRDMTDEEWERYTGNPDAAALGRWPTSSA